MVVDTEYYGAPGIVSNMISVPIFLLQTCPLHLIYDIYQIVSVF